MTDPGRFVEEGYDRLGAGYREWVARMPRGPRATFLDEVLRLIPRGADILEIGCGPGTDARALANDRRYTGVDLSRVQLAHARSVLRRGTFLHADVLDVELPATSFDAVVALYVFGHIPAARTTELFLRIAGWLRPGGWLCATFPISDDPGSIERGWIGAVDMFFSSLRPTDVDASLRSAGFEVRSARTIPEVEPDGEAVTFRWVIAQRTGVEDR